AGLERGAMAGPLVRHFPPIAPSADGGLTIWTTTAVEAQGSVAESVAPGATAVAVQDNAGCQTGEAACGFAPDTTAIAFTADGCRTVLRVSAVAETTLHLAAPLGGCALAPGSAVAQGDVRT